MSITSLSYALCFTLLKTHVLVLKTLRQQILHIKSSRNYSKWILKVSLNCAGNIRMDQNLFILQPHELGPLTYTD